VNSITFGSLNYEDMDNNLNNNKNNMVQQLNSPFTWQGPVNNISKNKNMNFFNDLDWDSVIPIDLIDIKTNNSNSNLPNNNSLVLSPKSNENKPNPPNNTNKPNKSGGGLFGGIMNKGKNNKDDTTNSSISISKPVANTNPNIAAKITDVIDISATNKR